MPTIHLPYGGSSAHRDIACPGNKARSADLPHPPTGQAAIDGSMHHQVMEECFRRDLEPADLIGLVYKEPGEDTTREFTADDLTLSEIGWRAINNVLDEYDIEDMMIEPFVQFIEGKSGGSIDVLGISADGKTAMIADFKFGTFRVSPEESAQHAVYALSAMTDPTTRDLFKKVKKIVFVIIQPQVKGVVSKWETKPQWIRTFQKKYEAAMASDTIRPGKHCKYCRAEPYCDAKRVNVMAANLLGGREQEELQAAADMVEEVEQWVKAVKNELYWHVSRGVPVTGWKVVDKRATRKWSDREGLVAALKLPKKDMFKPGELLSPAQMEKVIKSKKLDFPLDPYTVKESSGTTLAPDSDIREAVIVSDVTGKLEDMVGTPRKE